MFQINKDGKHIPIAELTPEMQVQDYYLLKDASLRIYGVDLPYFYATLADLSGEVNAILWGYDGDYLFTCVGSLIYITGQVKLVNDKPIIFMGRRIAICSPENCPCLQMILPGTSIDCQ